MDDEPPEQMNQGLQRQKTLVFSFESQQKQTDFIFELFCLKTDQAHFSLSIEKKNICLLTLFCSDPKVMLESENRIKEIAYNLDHHEKNKWWFW